MLPVHDELQQFELKLKASNRSIGCITEVQCSLFISQWLPLLFQPSRRCLAGPEGHLAVRLVRFKRPSEDDDDSALRTALRSQTWRDVFCRTQAVKISPRRSKLFPFNSETDLSLKKSKERRLWALPTRFPQKAAAVGNFRDFCIRVKLLQTGNC